MIDPDRVQKYSQNLHIRRLAGMLLVTIVMGAVAWKIFDWATPDQDNPFKPLDLQAPIGRATGLKLDMFEQRLESCFVALQGAGVEYTRIDKAGKDRACNLVNGLTLDRSLTPYSQTLSMTCPLAAALHVWERHVVIPAAHKYLKQDVTRIETFGSYSCRKVNGAKEGRWSNHAKGDAVDISGFRMEDGNIVSVEKHFFDKGPKGRFLREVRDKGCDLFSATLSPDYNAQHADHFHFDMGIWTTCS
jgi:hypothetical protein